MCFHEKEKKKSELIIMGHKNVITNAMLSVLRKQRTD